MSLLVPARRPPPEHQSAHAIRQVSWLGDRPRVAPSRPMFPGQWRVRRSSPLTVAGQRGLHTPFPLGPQRDLIVLRVYCAGALKSTALPQPALRRHSSLPSKVVAATRSSVSPPSVNQQKMGPWRSRAASRRSLAGRAHQSGRGPPIAEEQPPETFRRMERFSGMTPRSRVSRMWHGACTLSGRFCGAKAEPSHQKADRRQHVELARLHEGYILLLCHCRKMRLQCGSHSLA